ncbi:damage-inducible mutagenesis protein, partial [Rhizobium phaseoli]
MAHSGANPIISDLRDRIHHLEGAIARPKAVLPFGVVEIDEHLPGGGLTYGAVHEFAGGGAGAVDAAAAALFVAGVAART